MNNRNGIMWNNHNDNHSMLESWLIQD
jgi:hypothetical protein